ncbi:hypothetical protein AMECASPLE_025994 [Ameca splendens]|uniref:Uncharacterized protein n=1 Tax=Ameca splendens TaxID=208324 RepID=A0ABV0Y4N0_9TELE
MVRENPGTTSYLETYNFRFNLNFQLPTQTSQMSSGFMVRNDNYFKKFVQSSGLSIHCFLLIRDIVTGCKRSRKEPKISSSKRYSPVDSQEIQGVSQAIMDVKFSL